jgi:hypothetical protein
MALWEQILLGVVAAGVLLLFWPGANRMFKERPKGTREDWLGLLRPVGLVVLGILALIWLARVS